MRRWGRPNEPHFFALLDAAALSLRYPRRDGTTFNGRRGRCCSSRPGMLDGAACGRCRASVSLSPKRHSEVLDEAMRRDETWRAASRNSALRFRFVSVPPPLMHARTHTRRAPSLSPRPFRAVGGNDAYVWVHGRVRSRSCLIMHGSREHAAKKAARRHVHCPANVSLLDRSDTCYTRGHATFGAHWRLAADCGRTFSSFLMGGEWEVGGLGLGGGLLGCCADDGR